MMATLTAQLSNDHADPIDRVLWATRGEILRVGAQTGGEYDSLELVSRRDRRRLAGARLVSTDGGMRPDELHHVARHALAELSDLNGDQFVTWYVAECLAGLDYRASVRAGGGWEDQLRPEDDCDPTPPDHDVWTDEAFEALLATDDFGPAGVDDTVPAVVVGGVAPAWFTAWLLRTVHAPKAELLVELGVWAFEGGRLPGVPAAPWAPALVVKFGRRLGREVK